MISIEIPDKNKFLYLPEELAECDEKQFLDMSKLLLWLSTGIVTYESFRVLAVYALLGMKWDHKEYKTPGFMPEADERKWANVYQLSEYIDRFFEQTINDKGEEVTSIKQNFIKNHAPEIKLFGKFYGPDDAFENVTAGQYFDGMEYFISYTTYGDLKDLRNLFAIFYLPKGEEYDKEVSRKRAKGIFRTLDVRHLYGFYLMFSAMNKYLKSGSVVIYGEEIDLSIIYKDISKDKLKSSLPGLGWISTAQDLAESGVFGSYEAVRKTLMWPVLLRLYDLKKKGIDEIDRENANKNKA